MFELVRKTKKFNTDEPAEMTEYDAILSNPLCSIISRDKEKLRQETYDEGKLVASEEHIVFIVTWDTKQVE